LLSISSAGLGGLAPAEATSIVWIAAVIWMQFPVSPRTRVLRRQNAATDRSLLSDERDSTDRKCAVGCVVRRTLRAVYFRTADGSEPVREFIAGLDAKPRAALTRQIDRLNDLSDAVPHLPFPHSSQVAGELRELRCHLGSDHYRVLYRRSERLIVLLHAFPKKTGKLPQAEIKIAQERWGDFKARMDTHPRKPPRAAGRDAP
jgi:phage-related protein